MLRKKNQAPTAQHTNELGLNSVKHEDLLSLVIS